jgi:hypothetical protein
VGKSPLPDLEVARKIPYREVKNTKKGSILGYFGPFSAYFGGF